MGFSKAVSKKRVLFRLKEYLMLRHNQLIYPAIPKEKAILNS